MDVGAWLSLAQLAAGSWQEVLGDE